jgi:hypothetical protein
MRGRAFGRPARGLLHEPDHITASAASPERAMYRGLPEPGAASLWPCDADWPGRGACPGRAARDCRLGTFGQTPGHGVGHERVAPGLILRRPHAVADEECHRFQFIRQRTVGLGVAIQILAFVGPELPPRARSSLFPVAMDARSMKSGGSEAALTRRCGRSSRDSQRMQPRTAGMPFDAARMSAHPSRMTKRASIISRDGH